jgi:hypothetical protein
MVVGVVVEHRRIDHPWQSHRWQPVAVLPGEPAAPAWTVLGQGGGQGDDWVRYLAGTAELTLYPGETETYAYNLESPEPAIYVILRKSDDIRGIRLLGATVDPGEAHAHADTGDDLVEALPLPGAVRDWLAAFVEAYHVPRTKWKRKRDRADPEAMAIRVPGQGPGHYEGDGEHHGEDGDDE